MQPSLFDAEQYVLPLDEYELVVFTPENAALWNGGE